MGVVIMAIVGLGIRVRVETRNLGFRHVILIVIGVVGAAGLLLAVLHAIEAAIWAAAYLWLGALDVPKDAILYSLDSMTTRGASGLMLEQHWQMMGALEAADGMLLFGISTAYISH
jgi:disulfide bond formation protein DsbB